MEKQFTSTVFIIDNDRVLLIFHRKLQKWLPPGGHMNANETPPEAAKREAFEETGLEIAFIRQENIWVQHWNASSFERPYLCLLEEVPAFGDKPAHQHIDFIYLAYTVGGKIVRNETETDGIRWFSLEEIESLTSDKEIFAETKETIRHLLTQKFEVSGALV